jgi:hypothetical protein
VGDFIAAAELCAGEMNELRCGALLGTNYSLCFCSRAATEKEEVAQWVPAIQPLSR